MGLTVDRLMNGMPLYKAEETEDGSWATQKCIVKDPECGIYMMFVAGIRMEEIRNEDLGKTLFLHKWQCEDYCAKKNGYAGLIERYVRERGMIGGWTAYVPKLRKLFGAYNDEALLVQLARVI